MIAAVLSSHDTALSTLPLHCIQSNTSPKSSLVCANLDLVGVQARAGVVSTGSDLDSNAILAQVDVRLLPPAASHIKQQQKQQQHNIGTTERPVNSGSRSRHEYQHKYACFTRCQRLTPSLSRKTRSRAVRWGRLHLETQKKKEKKTQLRATSLKLIFAKCLYTFPRFSQFEHFVF